MSGVRHESVEGFVVKGSDLAKYVWLLQDSLTYGFWYFLGQQQQLVGIRVEGSGQLHDQLVRGIVSEVEAVILYFGDVCERDTYRFRQGPLAHLLPSSQAANSLAELHSWQPLAKDYRPE
jgi:hypothetical protein